MPCLHLSIDRGLRARGQVAEPRINSNNNSKPVIACTGRRAQVDSEKIRFSTLRSPRLWISGFVGNVKTCSCSRVFYVWIHGLYRAPENICQGRKVPQVGRGGRLQCPQHKSFRYDAGWPFAFTETEFGTKKGHDIYVAPVMECKYSHCPGSSFHSLPTRILDHLRRKTGPTHQGRIHPPNRVSSSITRSARKSWRLSRRTQQKLRTATKAGSGLVLMTSTVWASRWGKSKNWALLEPCFRLCHFMISRASSVDRGNIHWSINTVKKYLGNYVPPPPHTQAPTNSPTGPVNPTTNRPEHPTGPATNQPTNQPPSPPRVGQLRRGPPLGPESWVHAWFVANCAASHCPASHCKCNWMTHYNNLPI